MVKNYPACNFVHSDRISLWLSSFHFIPNERDHHLHFWRIVHFQVKFGESEFLSLLHRGIHLGLAETTVKVVTLLKEDNSQSYCDCHIPTLHPPRENGRVGLKVVESETLHHHHHHHRVQDESQRSHNPVETTTRSGKITNTLELQFHTWRQRVTQRGQAELPQY